jgi:hypothetical protein
MDIARVDGTLETLGCNVNLPPKMQLTFDLGCTPFEMKEEHLARMRALSKTGDTELAFIHEILYGTQYDLHDQLKNDSYVIAKRPICKDLMVEINSIRLIF